MTLGLIEARRDRQQPSSGVLRPDVGAVPRRCPAGGCDAAIASSSTRCRAPASRRGRRRRPRRTGRRTSRSAGRRSCNSVAIWFGTAVAACSSPNGVVPIGLTGRSWAWARAATRRKWVTPHTAAGLDDVDRASGQQRAELLEPGEVLAGGDGGADPRPTAASPRRPTGGPAPRPRSGRGSAPARATCRTACLRVQDSLASSMRPGASPGSPRRGRRGPGTAGAGRARRRGRP